MKQKSVYPSWRYHKTHGEKLVLNEQEDHALHHEWVDTPAKFEAVSVEQIVDEQSEMPKRRGRPRKDA